MDQDQHILEELRTIEMNIYWQAVYARDRRFNGVFVYGVRSTGIYCQPSCPSRRPRREQITFFPSCEVAEIASFRACLRCQPRRADTCDPQVEMVLRLCHMIESQTDGVISLTKLGAKLGVSPYHLQRIFKSITGITPRQYAAAHRLKQFKSRIKAGAAVTSALYDAGFSSSSRLYEKASEQLGMTPATYRRGGKGMNISYTIVDCRLGRLLVAATRRGVCAVQFGASDNELVLNLTAEYPAADIRHAPTHLDELIASLLCHLEEGQQQLALPLDLQATTFQLRVWEELRRIPYGGTRSYAEVAASIGQPRAARAVARACAANPVALVTPCHRVVRGDGNSGGYRWGLERKQALLSQEKNRACQSEAPPIKVKP